MLRYALRRVLWAIPTLFGISLLVFLLTTLVPDPALLAILPTSIDDALALEEKRRALFLDLPRFVNPQPEDARSRAEKAMTAVAEARADAPIAAAHLARLGGAAFPLELTRLEGLPPDARGRVALALAPIAVRAGLAKPEDLTQPDRAVRFWTRFWEDRALDFTEPAVRRAVSRLIEHGSELRERDLSVVDTFALDAIVAEMPGTHDRLALERLTRLAVHMAGRGEPVPPEADPARVHRVLTDWQEWWYVHRSDFVVLDGAERVAASLGETRYGKWILRSMTGRFGISLRDGEPVRDKMVRHAPVTLLVALLAMLASYALAVPIGVLAAWRRGYVVDRTLAVVLFVAYSLPTFCVAQLLHGASREAPGETTGRFVLAIVALTVGSLATLSRYQRSAMLDVLRQDFVRTARAKGVSSAREVVVHALRNALLPTVTLAGLQLPALLGGAFVVEEVFGLQGVGFETVRAVQAHDVPWLVATIVLAAVFTTAGLLASDVAYGLLDPRVREALLARGQGERA